MNHLPFDKPGRFYRGNLHTHSTRSDGRLSPEAVCRFYNDAGYDFLAITDHFMERYGYPITDTTPYRTDNFTTILGAELHAPAMSSGELWHILADGLPPDFAHNLPDESGPQLAQRAMQAGAFVSVAHPAWYALTEQDVLSLGQVDAIETINGISADHNDRIDSWYMLDVMLARGYRYNACATDDAHFQDRHNDRLRGWMWVKSEALTPEALLAALKRGEYYSSSGPQLFDLQISNQTVKIRCSPVDSIFVTGKAAQSQFKHGKGMIEAELDIRKLDSAYCRVTIRDAQGNRAWTNPIWLTVWSVSMEYAVNYTPQAADLLAQRKIAFDRFKCPAWPDLIAEAQKLYPVYVHFPLRIGMGIGDALDTERNQPADWGKVEALLRQTGTPFVNVHLAPITSDFPDIASGSDDPADMDRLIEAAQGDLESVIRRFGADKVIAENDYYYPGMYFRAATLPRYIRSVIESGNCGMLLDISHARLAARLLYRDAKDYLAGLPVERIREIHLTGIQHFDARWQEHMRQQGMPPDAIDHFADRWIDHVPMTEDDWTFYGWAFDQVRGAAWHTPWVASLEYGGVGALWQAMTDSAVLADQVPRLRSLLHDL